MQREFEEQETDIQGYRRIPESEAEVMKVIKKLKESHTVCNKSGTGMKTKSFKD